jgi:predicted nuclease of restriction endonuclease-like (RecB) superfamily
VSELKWPEAVVNEAHGSRRGVTVLVLLLVSAGASSQQQQDPLAEPFKGVTTDGNVIPGLFPIRATGVSTGPVRTAADQFIASLTDEQRQRTTYAVDDAEWRKWNNVHRYARQGVSFKEMSEQQRERAFAMMKAGLSAKGLAKSRAVMRLNGHLAELKNNFEEYGEGLYFLTVMGQPSATDPWGWQLDGHHLIVNYFVLGDQVVMTPTFMGSEPVIAESGRYAGTKVLQVEQDLGLAFMQSLTAEQQRAARIDTAKVRNNSLAQAFRDNLVLDYAGLRVNQLNASQRDKLLRVIGEYVGNVADGHAKVKMNEVRNHLDQTYFAWIGDASPNSVFYYRIQSPVVLIEFDHQTPVALPGARVPNRQHIHTVIRTPNGNDYGKDLLRQHYEKHKH